MAENPRIEELRRRVQRDPASIAFAQLAEEYRRCGNYEDAVQVCRAGLAKHTAYLSARVTLGRALIELEQYDEAKAELEYVLGSAPENLAAIRSLAEIHQRRGELDEALKRYRTALRIARHDPDIEESVNQLTRQLEPSPDAPPLPEAVREPLQSEEPSEPSFDEDQPPLQVPVAEVPPPIPFDAGETMPDADLQQAPAANGALDDASDEFTRALQALDALTIDFQPLALPRDETPAAATDATTSSDDRLVASADWEVAGFDAAWTNRRDRDVAASQAADASPWGQTASSADVMALKDLEAWLDGILADRDAREKTAGR